MVTREQCLAADWRAEFHYTGRLNCTRTVGPRGGVRTTITVARVNGAAVVCCHKRACDCNPADFRLPVKAGLSNYGAITRSNAYAWHLAADCPALASPAVFPARQRVYSMAAD